MKKKKRSSFLPYFLLIALGLIILVVVLPGQRPSSIKQQPKEQKVDFSEIEKSVKMLLREGVIHKIDPALNEVFMPRSIWESSTYEQKNTLGYVLAHYCGHKKGTNLYWVDIRDHRSGKKMGSWSKSWGMKIED